MLNKRYKIIAPCAPNLVKAFPLMVVGRTFVVNKVVHFPDGYDIICGMKEITMDCGTVYNIDIQSQYWCFYTENMVTCRLVELQVD